MLPRNGDDVAKHSHTRRDYQKWKRSYVKRVINTIKISQNGIDAIYEAEGDFGLKIFFIFISILAVVVYFVQEYFNQK